MAVLTNSRFGDDLKAIIEGITADIRTAWPDVIKVYADRNLMDDPNTPRAVIVPAGVQMIAGGSDPASSGIKTILQRYAFSIFLVERVTDKMDVIERKIDRADAMVGQLMANRQYLSVYELPIVTQVVIAEEEPDRKESVLQIDFEVQAVNYKHEAV